MRINTLTCVSMIVLAVFTGIAQAGPKAASAPEAVLNEQGTKLLAKYTEALEGLRKQIVSSLPAIGERQKAAYLAALEAENTAGANLAAAEKNLTALTKAAGLVNHGKSWIGKAEKNIAAAQAKLKTATNEAERNAAQDELATAQADRAAGIEALKQREQALASVKVDEPRFNRELEAAKQALARAEANSMKAFDGLGIKPFLASDKLDGQLAKFVVLNEATPRGLAAFAQQSPEHAALVDRLLANSALMVQMVEADGAKGGQYGRAMQIYTAIQKLSPKAKDGVLHRLALAVSMEHAEPIRQANPAERTDAPKTVDPVKRYQHFEKAYLDGELDPGFKSLSAWDYRMVVNGDETEEALVWGRQMLRNYRPDHISNPDYRWRYVEAVRTEVKYGSRDVKNDLPSLQSYQNIIMNGGVCGRRAFFGRFILRCFGIPTVPRPQKGHAALAHWTPSGWVVNLGADWGRGWAPSRASSDLDFLAVTQARQNPSTYIQVKRAQWIGDVLGEPRAYGFSSKRALSDFWNGLAGYRQLQIIQENKAVTLAAVGEDLGEANESKTEEVVRKTTVSDADRNITADRGVITIPAVACSKPTNSTKKIRFMPSILGGMQLHYNRTGGPEDFEYTFDAPAAGRYALTARVVTTSADQQMLVFVNAATEPTTIAVPFTIGMWDTTQPVQVTLVKGKNVLRFSRPEPVKGLTIKDFTLTPTK